jgi:hypothetical protein
MHGDRCAVRRVRSRSSSGRAGPWRRAYVCAEPSRRSGSCWSWSSLSWVQVSSTKTRREMIDAFLMACDRALCPGDRARAQPQPARFGPARARTRRYRMPIPGLMCGASTHPAGGVTGAPGHNAAREMIRDFRARRWIKGIFRIVLRSSSQEGQRPGRAASHS